MIVAVFCSTSTDPWSSIYWPSVEVDRGVRVEVGRGVRVEVGRGVRVGEERGVRVEVER